MAELDPRKQSILRAVVFEYVDAAEPVGSELLTQKYDLGVKSATIRNELADLSDLGYLEQPHTSAGRIPSDQGYRYYVDRLIIERAPDTNVKQRVKNAAEEGDALAEMLRQSTTVLSRLTHLFTVATMVRDANITVRNAVVSALGPSQALLVLVLSNGHVENRMIEIPAGLTLTELGQANELISKAVVGKSLRSFLRGKAPADAMSQSTEKLLSTLWSSLRSISKDLTRGSITTEGEEYLFGQPEFQRDAVALADLLDNIKDSEVLLDAVSAPGSEPTTITIGKENRHEQLHRLSVIRRSFFVGQTEAGTIAVIGPTRMRYESSIPLVNYTAQALSDALTRFFG